jgi:imidazolonepropionase-like amidohydrolase
MHALRAPVAFDGDSFLTEGATVLVDGGVIVGVEHLGYDVPEGCPVTTHAGTVLPGLIDAHVHLVSDAGLGSLERAGTLGAEELDGVIRESLRKQAAAGVTTVRDLGDVGYRTLSFRDELPDGAPRILAAGPPLTVPDGHCHYLGGVVGSTGEIAAAVADRVQRGVDVIKVMASGGLLTPGTDPFATQFDPTDLRVLVDTAHEAGLQVLAHAHSLSGIRHALAAGVDGIEHFTGATDGGLVVPDDVLDDVAAAGVVVDLTLGLDRAVWDSLPAPPPGIAAAMARLELDIDTFIARRMDVAARLHDHGIRVVSGDDAGAAPTKYHGVLPLAVLDLVTAGWPPAAALSTATGGGADACGIGSVTGRLRPGLAADLLVVDGDLRSDVDALRRPTAVLVRGVDAVG